MIVLTTDFGIKDTYAGEMKGRILSCSPESRILDLTHQVIPGNVSHGQFLLKFSYKYFPEETIFLSVVDPGVGTDRNNVAIYFDERWFVGPDNGLFSFAAEGKIFKINTTYEEFPEKIASTFHGRDIFSIAAGLLDKRKLSFIEEIPSLNVVKPIETIMAYQNTAKILHIDHFGNVITSVEGNLFEAVGFKAGGREITESAECFQRGLSNLFVINGSRNLLEIVSNGRSAADILRLKINQNIEVIKI